MPSEQGSRPYPILHCIDSLGCGGAEMQLLETLRHMDKSIFQCSVCYLYPPRQLEEDIVSLGIPVVNLNLKSPRRWLQAISGLRQLVNQYRIELIHASHFYANIYAPLAAATKRIPVIFTINSTLDAKEYVAGSSSAKLWRVRNFLLLRALILRATNTRLVAVSHSTKESAIRHLGIPPDRIDVVYRGLIPEHYDNRRFSIDVILRVKRELGLDDAYPVLINVARLHEAKGHKHLLEAMPHILKHFPKARLLIAGEGPQRGELEKLRDNLRLEQYVQLLGLRSDIPALLSVAHVFLFASYYEGLSNAVVEAMAAGKPVVAFDIPMMREVVGDGGAGVLLKGRDPERLGEEVVRLVSKPNEAKALGERGQQVIRQKFDIRQNVRQLEALYERVLADS